MVKFHFITPTSIMRSSLYLHKYLVVWLLSTVMQPIDPSQFFVSSKGYILVTHGKVFVSNFLMFLSASSLHILSSLSPLYISHLTLHHPLHVLHLHLLHLHLLYWCHLIYPQWILHLLIFCLLHHPFFDLRVPHSLLLVLLHYYCLLQILWLHFTCCFLDLMPKFGAPCIAFG